MKYFSILAERCSGSIFVQYALLRNFNIEYKKCQEKHFFGFSEDVFTDNDADETLFIFVIRNPIDWIDSYFKRLHHVPEENRKNIQNFINNEWYSVYEIDPIKNTEIMEDRNMFTGNRYKDIFELRKKKTEYLLNVFKNKVNNFLVLRYEDMRDSYDLTLESIKEKFQLEKRNQDYVPIPKYKGTYDALYYKKPIIISEDIIDEIKKRLDKVQEENLGYLL
jgi:hypothetical protein